MINAQGGPYEPLVRAVWGWPDQTHNCAACIDELPDLVVAEVSGSRWAGAFERTRRHILLCPACEALYLDLLEFTWADLTGDE